MDAPTLAQDIFFFHVMKTAGTTVVRLLEQAFGPEASCALPTHEGADAGPFLERVDAVRPLVVSGHPHHLFPLWERALARTGPRSAMTFLRHPVERFLSCYYFITQSNYVQTRVGRFDLSLPEALGCNDPRLARNMMTKALASLGRPRDYAAPADRADLDRALDNLEAMDFVGLAEEFAWSYALLALTFGFEPPPITSWNVNASRPGAADLDPALVERIMADNALDLALYAHGVKLFAARVEAASGDLAPVMEGLTVSDTVYHMKPVQKPPLRAPMKKD
ncbi:sulfotransferase family 2 domain-containing protein [Desulfocurvus sp. DL9XJH121]